MEDERHSQTPVALFTYNRPDHTKQVLESLLRCRRLEECHLFIYCDGPKNPSQAKNVDASRSVVRTFAERHPATVILRKSNLGLSRSVVRGVSELCERFGRVIVIEDDFVLSPSFIDYMLQALDRYEYEENVYQISGFMFPVPHPEKPDALFLPFTTSWGWATWQRAWKIFDWEARGYQELLSDKITKKRFNLDDTYPYYAMLKQRFSGKNDSWAILWWYAVFRAKGLVLHPKRSLVFVGGFDSSGTHCSASDMQLTSINNLWQFEPDRQLVFPDDIASDDSAFSRIKLFLISQHSQSLPSRIRRFVGNL